MARRDEATCLAEAILAFRLKRPAEFPAGLFGETGWEFLLALFIADSQGRSTSGRAIADRIGVPEAVASRWLRYLASQNLVEGDGDGDLDDALVMSSTGIDHMESLLEHAKELRRTLLPDI